MTKDAYLALYEKYVAGQCTAAEIQLLEEYRDAFELADLPWDEAVMGNESQIKHRIRKRLLRQVGRPHIRWYTYAAAAVLAIGVTVLMGLYVQKEFRSESLAQHEQILPGGNKAHLTLEDGTQVALGQVDETQLTGRGQGAIRQLADGKLVYGNPSTTEHVASPYHTIRTPRGGTISG